MKDNGTIQLLCAAKKLIDQPHKWTTGTDFRGRGRNISYCARGAMRRVQEHKGFPIGVFCNAENELERTIGVENPYYVFDLTTYNDHVTHNEILALFDTTINRLRKEGS